MTYWEITEVRHTYWVFKTSIWTLHIMYLFIYIYIYPGQIYRHGITFRISVPWLRHSALRDQTQASCVVKCPPYASCTCFYVNWIQTLNCCLSSPPLPYKGREEELYIPQNHIHHQNHYLFTFHHPLRTGEQGEHDHVQGIQRFLANAALPEPKLCGS